VKRKQKVVRFIFKDIFGTKELVPAQSLKAEVRQMSNDHYVLPAFLLSTYPMQGAMQTFISQYGLAIKGFVEQCDHIEHDDKDPGYGVFRREEWIVPYSALR
jgi:hypothetical protein